MITSFIKKAVGYARHTRVYADVQINPFGWWRCSARAKRIAPGAYYAFASFGPFMFTADVDYELA